MASWFRTAFLAGTITLSAGCSGLAQTPPSNTAATAPSIPPPPGQLQTPGEAGKKDVESAAEAPLHDVNLIRQRIPPVLLAAITDPYAPPQPLNCQTLIRDIDDLSAALGPDYDAPPTPHHHKKVTDSGGLGLSLMHGAAENLLPFHGYVATLSGAEKHDELVIHAIGAGSARRAYLKGLGEARRCPAPATPRHLAVPAPPYYDGPRKPKYPIR